jgi:hypothetical protein
MSDELFRIVRTADPIGTGIYPEVPSRVRLEGIFARLDQQESARREKRRLKRLVLILAAFAGAAALAGLAVAASGWLSGSPAPPAVVTNFQHYTPQLGFHPNASDAVLVGQDNDISLYATTNDEGTYCLTVAAPWKSTTTNDGGVCVPVPIASRPLVAGIVGASSNRPGGDITLVVAGRTDDPAADAVRFDDPDGEVVSRPVGRSGFFVAGVDADLDPCPSDGWSSAFTVIDADGRALHRTSVPLVQSRQQGDICAVVFSFLR